MSSKKTPQVPALAGMTPLGYHETKVVTPSVDDIMRYENSDMDEAETIEFFQRLVDTGLAWQLQGSYGRTANDLLKAGLISIPSGLQRR